MGVDAEVVGQIVAVIRSLVPGASMTHESRRLDRILPVAGE
jgi:hypothetical protein